MEKEKGSPELLAPAGSLENLKTAFYFGSDAVYTGLKYFNLRYRARNLTEEDLEKGIELANTMGKKVYITLNALVHESELDKLKKTVKILKRLKPHGIIVHDTGVFLYLKEQLPDIEFHLSTQSSTTNSLSAKFWSKNGIKRIILARELYIDEVRNIVENVKEIEFEVFIHGAVCIAYSGRCFLSFQYTGRDANKGDCAQCCRWEYKIIEKKHPDMVLEVYENESFSTILSAYDLCRLPEIENWIDTGVKSFKIEGRMKNNYYIANTIRVYKAAIEEAIKGTLTKEKKEAFLKELDSYTHRPYSLYINQKPFLPENNIKDIYIGDIIDIISENKLMIIARGKIEINNSYEVIYPSEKGKLNNAIFTIKEIKDKKGNKVLKGGGGEKYLIKIDGTIKKYGIIRKVLNEVNLREASGF